MTKPGTLNPETLRELDREYLTLIASGEYQQQPIEDLRQQIERLPSNDQRLPELKRRKAALVAQLAAWDQRMDEIEAVMMARAASPRPRITNESEFESFMLTIDQDLARRQVPVTARQIQAIGEAAQRLGIGLINGPLSPGPPKAGDYRRANLSKRIRDWFGQRYGDKLKIDLSLGRAVVELRGDAWLIRIPYIIGSVDIVLDRDIEKAFPHLSGPANPGRVTFNVLQAVEGLTPSIAKSLTDEEVAAIHRSFAPALVVFLLLDELSKIDPMIVAAREDLHKAGEICVNDRGARGFSRWHSLQGIEKLLKVFISKRGGSFKRNHSLRDQANTAQSLGGTPLDHDLLASVQCSADVRYKPSLTTLEQAARAHHSAMILARLILGDIKSAASAGGAPQRPEP